MPYSDTIGVTPASLIYIAAYLSNEGHGHHKDYDLTPIQVLGVKSVQQFIAYAVEAFRMNSRKKVGRPPKNAANWVIVRTPDGTNLEPQEMAAYEHAIFEATGLGGPVVGIHNWHKNKYTGAADLNLLAAAFTSRGELVRDRDSDIRKHLRWTIDQVTDELNVLRKAQGITSIVTMPEIKRDRAHERGEEDLIEELARMPKPPRTTADLEPTLLSLGCEITRPDRGTDSISVKMPGKKKAKKVRILKLLADIAVAIDRLRTTRELPQPKPGLSEIS